MRLHRAKNAVNFKTKIDENAADQIGNKFNKKISDNPDVRYLCKSWNVDLSVFELPKGIVFQDK